MSDYTDEDVQAASEALYLVDYGRWTSGPDPLGTPWGTSREQQMRATYTRDALTILDAVAPAIVRRAKAEALRELSSRLFRADVELSRMKHQPERITGKAEGVRLAQSYADETVRQIEAAS